MARYLLIVNDYSHPLRGTNDWKGTFDSQESAEEIGKKTIQEEWGYCSYDVVDLLEWLELDPVKT